MRDSPVLQWLHETEVRMDIGGDHVWFEVRPRLVCNDGFEMSVQASPGHHCNMYIANGHGASTPTNYVDCEVWCLTEDEPLLHEYGLTPDNVDDPAGYVPIKLLDEVVRKHGGIVGQKPPQKVRIGKVRRKLIL